MDWKKYFDNGKELIVSSSSKDSTPNANIVVSHGFHGDGLLIADCQMKTTIKNLIENPIVCVVGGGYLRLMGSVEIFSSGEYVDIIKARDESIASGEYSIHHAILINIDSVYDLDKSQMVFQARKGRLQVDEFPLDTQSGSETGTERKDTTPVESVALDNVSDISERLTRIKRILVPDSFIEDPPKAGEPPQILCKSESVGPWGSFYPMTRCANAMAGLCSVCGYTTLRRDIPPEEVVKSVRDQFESLMKNFEDYVINNNNGKIYAPGIINPVGFTFSPTGSYFAEAELPSNLRVYILRRFVEEMEKYPDLNLVLTIEAHARDVVGKIKSGYFDSDVGRDEIDLLRKLKANVILGFESSNDLVRNGLYNKGLNISDFERSVEELHKHGLEVGAFVFCGLPPMTDIEAKNDALSTTNYLSERGVYPVLMFGNIQTNTITDLLFEDGKYKMLEPFTVADTIAGMLAILQNGENKNWLVPDPVIGPPEPESHIFNRGITETDTNQKIHKMLRDLRNSRDVKTYLSQLKALHQKDEYNKYKKELLRQEEEVAGRSLLGRIDQMIAYIESPGVIKAYKKRKSN